MQELIVQQIHHKSETMDRCCGSVQSRSRILGLFQISTGRLRVLLHHSAVPTLVAACQPSMGQVHEAAAGCFASAGMFAVVMLPTC